LRTAYLLLSLATGGAAIAVFEVPIVALLAARELQDSVSACRGTGHARIAYADAGGAHIVERAQVRVVTGEAIGLNEICRARDAATRAELGHVARAGLGPAPGGRRFERIAGTGVAKAITELSAIAGARRRSTAPRALGIEGARIAHSIAEIRKVALAGRGPALLRALEVRRAEAYGTGTELG